MTPPGPVTPDSGDELAVVQIVNEGAPIVTITMDGQVILGDGYTIDEAARAFWDAIAEHAAQMTEQARAEERNRIAAAIDNYAGPTSFPSSEYWDGHTHALDAAARIARGGT